MLLRIIAAVVVAACWLTVAIVYSVAHPPSMRWETLDPCVFRNIRLSIPCEIEKEVRPPEDQVYALALLWFWWVMLVLGIVCSAWLWITERAMLHDQLQLTLVMVWIFWTMNTYVAWSANQWVVCGLFGFLAPVLNFVIMLVRHVQCGLPVYLRREV